MRIREDRLGRDGKRTAADALHWIAKNDKDAMTAFVEDYVRHNHKTSTITGVRVWQDKEAY